MKRIILCGGSGYIGTKLTEILLEKTDYHLIIIDRLDFKLDSDFRNKFYDSDRVEFHQKDIRDLNFMNEHCSEYTSLYKVKYISLIKITCDIILSPARWGRGRAKRDPRHPVRLRISILTVRSSIASSHLSIAKVSGLSVPLLDQV